MGWMLERRSDNVTVLIDDVDPDNWGQGGESATVLREKRRAQ